MGTITNKITIFWPERDVNFLKRNWRLSNQEIGRKLNRNPKSVIEKRKALKLPHRECDIVPLSFLQHQLIYGSLLGDGSTVKGEKDKNCRFSEAHSVKQKEYLLFKFKELQPFSGKFIEYPGRYGIEVKFSTKAHTIFNSFRKMFYNKNGQKIIKFATLKHITHPLALAIWFGDDGSKDTRSYRLATAKFSIKEIKLLIKWLKEVFKIESFLHKHGRYWYIAIRKDRWKFTKLVEPYLPECLHYKLWKYE